MTIMEIEFNMALKGENDMIKKTFVVLLLVFIALTPVFADFDFFFGTDFSVSGTKVFKTEGITDKAAAKAYVELEYEKENFYVDVKGTVSLSSKSSAEYDLEKVYASYRIISYKDNPLTIMAGKYPSKWGLGFIDGYKTGNIITPEDNEYSVSAAQDFDNGWSADLQVVLPLDNNKTVKIGAQGRKDFSLETLKEARLTASINLSAKTVSATAAAKLNAWADFVVGTEFDYNYDKDASTETKLVFAASALKDFEISIDSKAKTLTDALTLNFILEGGKYSQTVIVNHATLGLTDKTDIYSKTKLSIGSGITAFEQIIGATYTLEKGLVADGFITIDTESVMLSAVLRYNY